MALSSPGIGSGLDVKGIVAQLVAIERRPIALLQDVQTRLNSQLSSLGLLQSHVGNLQSSAIQLARADFWTQATASSSDPTAVSATARGSASPGTYTIDVTSLATAQSVASPPVTDPADVGTGTLTVTVGAASVSVTIGETDRSLQGIRDKINSAGAGVRASVVTDSSGSRLVLTGERTGAAHAFTVSVTGATGELAALTYPGGLSLKRPAADALLNVDGLDVTSASNNLDGVIEGLDITLTKPMTGPVTVTVSRDAAALRKGIEAFITNYNGVNSFLGAQTKHDEGTRTAGALQGDRTAVGLQNALRSLAYQQSDASAVFQRLADLGIAQQRDGSLKIEDEKKFTAALANPSELAQAFGKPTTGFAQRFKALTDGVLGVTGSITTRSSSLRENIKRNEKDQQRLEDRVARTQERLLKQYQALDGRMGTLTNLSNYVTQQMTMLNRTFISDK